MHYTFPHLPLTPRVHSSAHYASPRPRLQKLLRRITDLDGGKMLAELQKQRQLDYLASRALRRMLSVDLAWGWSKWAGWCVDQRQLRFAVRRWVRMGVGRCLTTWAEVANRRAQQTRLLRTGVSRISRPRLSACMALWRRDWEAHLINGGVKSRMDELQAALDDARALAERLERDMEAEVQARMSEELARIAEAEANAERARLAAQEEARRQEAQREAALQRIADLEAQLSDACHELEQTKTLAESRRGAADELDAARASAARLEASMAELLERERMLREQLSASRGEGDVDGARERLGASLLEAENEIERLRALCSAREEQMHAATSTLEAVRIEMERIRSGANEAEDVGRYWKAEAGKLQDQIQQASGLIAETIGPDPIAGGASSDAQAAAALAARAAINSPAGVTSAPRPAPLPRAVSLMVDRLRSLEQLLRTSQKETDEAAAAMVALAAEAMELREVASQERTKAKFQRQRLVSSSLKSLSQLRAHLVYALSGLREVTGGGDAATAGDGDDGLAYAQLAWSPAEKKWALQHHGAKWQSEPRYNFDVLQLQVPKSAARSAARGGLPAAGPAPPAPLQSPQQSQLPPASSRVPFPPRPLPFTPPGSAATSAYPSACASRASSAGLGRSMGRSASHGLLSPITSSGVHIEQQHTYGNGPWSTSPLAAASYTQESPWTAPPQERPTSSAAGGPRTWREARYGYDGE